MDYATFYAILSKFLWICCRMQVVTWKVQKICFQVPYYNHLPLEANFRNNERNRSRSWLNSSSSKLSFSKIIAGLVFEHKSTSLLNPINLDYYLVKNLILALNKLNNSALTSIMNSKDSKPLEYFLKKDPLHLHVIAITYLEIWPFVLDYLT